jgi:Putative Ig domain
MPETSLHMDIARWSGVSAVGSPRNTTGRLVVQGATSYVVLQTPSEGYQELYITPAGAVAIRAAPGQDLPRVGAYGDNKIRNCAVWVRADGKTMLSLIREDNGVLYDVSAAAGALTAAVSPALDPREENVTRFGPGPVTVGGAPARVWIKCVPGTASGLILQDATGLPWVAWVNAANVLQITNWDTFTKVGLTITTASLAGGTVGVAYSATLAATGGMTPYTWSLVGGTLPAGLTLSTAGVISGTPTAAGTSNFTVQVVATQGPTATRALSIVVA